MDELQISEIIDGFALKGVVSIPTLGNSLPQYYLEFNIQSNVTLEEFEEIIGNKISECYFINAKKAHGKHLNTTAKRLFFNFKKFSPDKEHTKNKIFSTQHNKELSELIRQDSPIFKTVEQLGKIKNVIIERNSQVTSESLFVQMEFTFKMGYDDSVKRMVSILALVSGYAKLGNITQISYMSEEVIFRAAYDINIAENGNLTVSEIAASNLRELSTSIDIATKLLISTQEKPQLLSYLNELFRRNHGFSEIKEIARMPEGEFSELSFQLQEIISNLTNT